MKMMTVFLMMFMFAGLALAADAEMLVIDVRSDEEWAEGHIDSAVHIPHTEIKEKISAHAADKSTPVVLYCRSGGRAGKALKVLKKMGYTNVKNLGGLEDARKELGK